MLKDKEEASAPLTTIEDYEHGKCSFAHIYGDKNEISRFGEKIGTLKDLKLTEGSTVTNVDYANAIPNIFTWKRPKKEAL